jgi:hypothetical protein
VRAPRPNSAFTPCTRAPPQAEPVKAHVGPLVKNLLPAGKKLPIKRAIKCAAGRARAG